MLHYRSQLVAGFRGPTGKSLLYEENKGMFAGRLMSLNQGQFSCPRGEIFPAVQIQDNSAMAGIYLETASDSYFYMLQLLF